MRNYSFLWVLLLVYGVSGAEPDKEISVTEGGTVILPGFPGVQRRDTILWKFGETSIVRVLEADNIHKYSNGTFTGRLKLDSQTGSLTITNITSDHAGKYKLEIKNNDKNGLSKIFIVTVNVYVGEKSMSKMVGDSFPLYIDVKEREVHQIQWKFGNQVLNTDRLNDPKWSNIQLNNKTGALAIKHITRDQFGYYEVRINTSCLNFHGEFRVESRWSFLEIWGIVLSFLLVVIGIIFILWKCCWNKICCKRQPLRS